MTHELKRSVMNEQGVTEDHIDHYAREKQAWLNQEAMVEKTKNEDNPLKKYTSYPHPIHHPLVVASIKHDGTTDYKIEEDMDDVNEEKRQREFADKKIKLHLSVEKIEKEEKEKTLPMGKERLMHMHIERIAIDNLQKNADLAYVTPKEDRDFLDEVKVIKEKLKAIDWWAAEQMSEVADLTEENIDAWKPTLMKV